MPEFDLLTEPWLACARLSDGHTDRKERAMCFNLLDEKWIPIIWRCGKPDRVGNSAADRLLPTSDCLFRLAADRQVLARPGMRLTSPPAGAILPADCSTK